MNLNDLKDKRIGILGFGLEGRAVALYLQKNGFEFFVYDKNEELVKDPLYNQTNFYLGSDYLERASECEIIFRSPGIKLKDIEPLLKKGQVLTSQIRFFFDNCKAKIIGITGTKGKSTTAKLTFEILKNAGFNVFLGGNFGAPVLDLVDTLTESDLVVLELSSFQLQDLDKSPYIAVVLMIDVDHLDYHDDEKEYVEAKSAITKFQGKDDFAVINYNYPSSKKIGKLGDAKKYFVQTVSREDLGPIDPFKIYNPEEYLEIKDGIYSEEVQEHIYLIQNSEKKDFMSVKDVPLRGFHNIQNVGAAIQVACILNVKEDLIKESISKFEALDHRLQLVAQAKGIKFYDDSISTTTESTLASVKAFDEPIVLILGGHDKGIDYSDFAKQICARKNIQALILIGEVGEKLKEIFAKENYSGKIMTGSQNMSEVFEQIKDVAKEGDIVLLSPATSSFGMFKDYKDRGNQFKEQALQYNG